MDIGSDAQKVLVVGAGVGGLAAAIRLAVAGFSVTLAEAQATPGGKMRALATPAGPVDAGPTVLTLRGIFDDLFTMAGERLEDHLALIPQPILARHWWPDGGRLDLFADPEASTAAIATFAGPKAAAEFRRFDRQSRALYRAFDGPVMQAGRPDLPRILRNALAAPAIWPALSGRSLAQHLAHSFTDPRLRQLFGRYATYVGGVPHLSPAVLALIWQAEAQGVWAVQGGMHRLAEALAALAERRGVQLRYGVSVAQILQSGSRVTGALLSDGQSLTTDAVVFNGDPAALAAGYLGAAPQWALSPSHVQPRSLSAAVWSFAATPSPFDLVHHNVFFGRDPALEFTPLAEGHLPEEGTLYVCAQDRATPGHPGGPERFEIILNAPPDPSISLQEAPTCRAKTFPPLARFGLTFSTEPPDSALTTPQGFAALSPGSEGAIYGRSPHGAMKGALSSFQRPGARTRLKGLYLAGGGAHPGAGVPMAALSGRHAAEAIVTDLTSR